MALRLTCPACQSDVEALASDRGKSIKCGTCWANVVVPLENPSATATPLKVAVAKPITPVVAKAIPLPTPAAPASSTTTPAAAVPVLAKVVPVTAIPAKATDLKPAKPRFKSRDDKDRDDDDNHAGDKGRGKRKPKRDWDDDDSDDKKKKEKSGGGLGLMIGIIAVIVVVVLGLIGGLIFMLMSGGGSPTTTPTINITPNNGSPFKPVGPLGGDFAGGNGGFNPPAFDPPKMPPRINQNPNPRPGENKPQEDPNNPVHPKPITQEWAKQDFKNGATGLTPPRLAKENITVALDNNEGVLSGNKAVSEDTECSYHFFHFDLLEGKEYDIKNVAKQCLKNIHATEINGIDDAKFDGKASKKIDIRGPFGGLTDGYIVKLGYRVYVFFVLSKETFYKQSNATVEERTKKFFDSIKITFDPKTSNPYEGEPEWVAMQKTVGFKVNLPREYNGVTVTAHNAGFFDNVPGKVYKAEIDNITYEVYVHDLALQPKKGYADVVKALIENHKVINGPDDAKLGGLKAEEYLTNNFNTSVAMRSTTVGRKVYSARVSRVSDWGAKVGDKLYADRARVFFDSVRFDGVAAPPANPGGSPVKPAGPAASSQTMAILDKKVDPFWCAVVLPNRKELITAGLRGGNTANVGGVLTRYSLPDFKQLGTYTFHQPIFRMVASEPGGRLYFASASTPADAKGMPEREIGTLLGNINAVELKLFTDGTLTDGDKLKVAQTYAVSGAISGLELSAAGDALFVSTVTMAGKRPDIKPKGGKLLKCETISGKWSPEIITDSPIWAMSLSADGQLVGAIERRLEGGGGSLILVDTVAWKRTKSTNVTDTPEDAAKGEPGTMVVLQASATNCKLVSLGGIGETQVVMLDKPMQYAEVLDGGKQVLLSRGAGENSVMFADIDWIKGVLKPLATNDTLGGNFIVTPDGQYAIWNNGSVVDLKKIKKY
jgi:hypothetical protein